MKKLTSQDEQPTAQVSDLVERLRQIPREAFAAPAVQKVLGNLRIDDASLRPYLFFVPKTYTRNLIFRDDKFELLAVCWDVATCSPIHDHSGQECWLYVHRGTLAIDGYELVDDGQSGLTGEGIRLREGERVARIEGGVIDHRGPAHDIHRVVNRRRFGTRAVSLHVYALPFDDCIVYDTQRHVAQRQALVYHSVRGVKRGP